MIDAIVPGHPNYFIEDEAERRLLVSQAEA